MHCGANRLAVCGLVIDCGQFDAGVTNESPTTQRQVRA